MKKPEVVNQPYFPATFSKAQEFLNAYEILEGHNEAIHKKALALETPGVWKKSTPSELTVWTLAPTVVCLAFSVELHLKAMIAIVTGEEPEREHQITRLFDALPKEIRSTIKANVIGIATARGLKLDEAEFATSMKVINQGFIDWRYPTRDGMNAYRPAFALCLVEAIRTMIGNMKV